MSQQRAAFVTAALMLVACGGAGPSALAPPPSIGDPQADADAGGLGGANNDLGTGTDFATGAGSTGLSLAMTNCGSIPAQISSSRSSGVVYLATSASAAVSNASGATVPCEDRGDTGGVWSFASYANLVAAPFVFGSGWTAQNSGSITDNAVAAPTGTTTAARLLDTDATSMFQIYQSPFTTGNTSSTLWVKNDATAPTVPGAIWQNSDASRGSSNGNSATWHRNHYFDTGGQYFAIDPAGNDPVGTFVGTATGGIDAWGAQTIQTGVDLPLAAGGSIAAQTVRLTSGALSSVVISGDLAVDVCFRQDAMDINSVPDGYVWSAANAGGLFALQYASSSQTWTFTAKGATALTTTMGVGAYGTETCVRTEFKPSTNTSLLRVSTQGAVENTQIATGTTSSSSALSAMTSFYLGSNIGTSNWPARFTSLSTGKNVKSFVPEILVVGDSILSWTTLSGLFDQSLGGSFIYTLAQSRARAGIISIAHPGDKAEDQKSAFDAWFAGRSTTEKSAIKAIIIQVGINNVGAGAEDAATTVAALNDLIADIHASLPTAKIVQGEMLPAKAYLASTLSTNYPANYNAWTSANASIAAGLTGVNCVVTANSTLVNDGADNLAAQYGFGDGVHENNLGKQTSWGPFVTSLTTCAGIFP